MKNLSPALALIIALIPMAAFAGPTMAIWSGEPGSLSSALTTPVGRPFDVVVTLNTDGHEGNAAEFVMTDLTLEFPGVMTVNVTKFLDTTLDLGDNSVGEYLIAFGDCVPASDQIELVRVTYLDFNGDIGSTSIVMKIRGFKSGDSQPSTFGGLPGFADCEANGYAAPMGGNDAGGSLCVNCYLPPTGEGSVSDLKSKF